VQYVAIAKILKQVPSMIGKLLKDTEVR